MEHALKHLDNPTKVKLALIAAMNLLDVYRRAFLTAEQTTCHAIRFAAEERGAPTLVHHADGVKLGLNSLRKLQVELNKAEAKLHEILE